MWDSSSESKIKNSRSQIFHAFSHRLAVNSLTLTNTCPCACFSKQYYNFLSFCHLARMYPKISWTNTATLYTHCGKLNKEEREKYLCLVGKEVVQRLRALTALAEIRTQLPAPTQQFKEAQPLLASMRTRYTHSAHTSMKANIHTHKMKINLYILLIYIHMYIY